MSSTSEHHPDTVGQFATDLRRLRLDAGSPTLARLQSETGISRTVLSDAFAGRNLPSERTVVFIARACDTDPAPWLTRRRDLLNATKDAEASGAATAVDTSSADVSDAARPGVSRRAVAWIGAGSFVAGVLAGVAMLLLVVPALLPAVAEPPIAAETTTATGAQTVVANGTDPAQTACVDDARVATGDTRADNSLLEIVWSDKCQAGWGRITRYDGVYQGNTVSIAIYPATAPDGPDRQEATEHDVQGAYTTLVVRPSPDTLLCAEGSFTVDGTRIDLGDPLCI